ncbi:MAG TPA: DNA repair protein RecO [Trueperaceae bacterium]
MSTRYRLGHGIVIRRQALPSGDVVVTLLAEEGKWRGIARKGKLPGGNVGRLSLFHDVTVQYYRRREEDLALLTQVRLNGALSRLSDPAVYPFAHILAELADALTVDVNIGEPLYHYLASGLRGLNRHPDPERVALLYAWRLLGQAGLAPRCSPCGGCGRELPLDRLDVGTGALLCSECGAGFELGRVAGAELAGLVEGDMHAALELPLCDRRTHWLALSRYLSYHVGELRSLADRPRPEAAAGV